MTTLTDTNLTLMDWAKRRNPDGSAAKIANILSQTNEILADAVYREANGSTSHTVTISTGLPDIYFRSYNQGIPESKATTAQVVEAMSIMEARSVVDRDLADLEADKAMFRASEARMFLEGMNQKMARTLFYGNRGTDSQSFTGLAPRYSSLSAGNAQNIIDGEGTTANAQTSVWLCCWSEETMFCIFPKGSMAGLNQRDLGEQSIRKADDTTYQAYVEWFQWKSGFVLKDWRYAVRIPNLEVASLVALSGAQAPGTITHLLHKMALAANRLQSYDMGRCAWYVNRTVFGALMRLAMEKSFSALSIQQGLSQFGTPRSYLSFLDIPIRRCDALLNTEDVVS